MKNWLKITLFTLTVLIGSLGFAGFLTAMTTPPVAETITTKPVIVDKPLLTLINDLRAEKGVHLLIHSPELDKSAQEKADDMASNHYFDHVSPDGVRGINIIPNYLPQATRGSENLAYCGKNDNNTGAFDLWLNSPAHYQGMIDPTVTLYGEGKAWDDEKGCTVFVNHFANV